MFVALNRPYVLRKSRKSKFVWNTTKTFVGGRKLRPQGAEVRGEPIVPGRNSSGLVEPAGPRRHTAHCPRRDPTAPGRTDRRQPKPVRETRKCMPATGSAASAFNPPLVASGLGQTSRPLPTPALTCAPRADFPAIGDWWSGTGDLRERAVGEKRPAHGSPAARRSRGPATRRPRPAPDSGGAGGGARGPSPFGSRL